MQYFDVHVFIARDKGYSFGVSIDSVDDLDDDDVIQHAVTQNKFSELGDEDLVDTVDSITETEYNDWYGRNEE